MTRTPGSRCWAGRGPWQRVPMPYSVTTISSRRELRERVRWTPDLGASGPYDVYAHWTAAANRATNAPYTINHAGGSTVVRVDQQVNGGSSTLWGPSSSSLGSAARWSCPPMPTASSSPTRSASARSQRRDEIGHYY